MVKLLRFLLILILIVDLAYASADTDTSVRIFKRNFKTLKTAVDGDFMAQPVIRLGTDDRIVVTFDEIGEDNSYLEYRILHCNADWQPSRLLESEYIDGFNSQRIEDFAFSASTFVHYVNYRIVIPDPDMPVIHSGNYLLQVYDPDYPDDIILQTRFRVSENAAPISGTVTSRTDRGFNTRWQQVSFDIDAEGTRNFNPYQDVIVEISRNMSDYTSRIIRNPFMVDGNSIIYDHLPDLIFPASNEYRRFESVSNGFAGLHVDSLRYMGSNYHVWLKPDRPRAEAQYSYDRTQHGRFLVHEYNATDSDVAADYITVHFRLQSPEYKDADVYIDGEFTSNVFSDFNRMTYDSSLGAYVAEIPLKQGAYNYQYVTVPKSGVGKASTDVIEGDKYETENEYGIAVYYSPPGSRGDRLISFRTLEGGRY